MNGPTRTWDRTESRYDSDPIFHSLVDVLLAHLYQDDFKTYTPSDLRQAANYASFLFEARNIRPRYLYASPEQERFFTEMEHKTVGLCRCAKCEEPRHK